eukprot:2156520-Rhodomonas_salina.1
MFSSEFEKVEGQPGFRSGSLYPGTATTTSTSCRNSYPSRNSYPTQTIATHGPSRAWPQSARTVGVMSSLLQAGTQVPG